jgi:hypothetical protein
MSNATNAASSTAQTNAEGASGTSAQGKGAENTQTLTRAEAEAMIASALDRQRNQLHAEFRRTGKPNKSSTQQNGGENTAGNSTQNQGKQPLIPAKEVQDPRVDQLLAKHSKSLRTAAFANAISGVGLAGADAELLSGFIEGTYGSQIKVDTETDQVFFEDEDGSQKSINELVQFVHSKHKDRFAPAKKTVNANGAAGHGGNANGGSNPYAKLAYPEIMKAVQRGDKQASDYVTQNNDEFQAKKQQHLATKS